MKRLTWFVHAVERTDRGIQNRILRGTCDSCCHVEGHRKYNGGISTKYVHPATIKRITPGGSLIRGDSNRGREWHASGKRRRQRSLFYFSGVDVDTNRLFSIVVATIITVCSAVDGQAVIISGFDAMRHERFLGGGAPNPGFLVDQNLITGVGLERAILITPLHYITAVHAGSTMPTFYGSDGSLHTYQSAGSVALTTQLGGGMTASSDIALHTLTAPVPLAHGVTPLAIADGSFSDFAGMEFFAFGANSRAGRNVIDGFSIVENQDGLLDSIAIRFSYDTMTNGGTGGLGIDEVGLLGGDSGNGAIIQVGNQVGLIGAHFGILEPMGNMAVNGDRYDSFSTFLAPYLPEIDTLVAADGHAVTRLSVSAIPEPSAGFVCTVFMAGLIVRRRGRRGSSFSSDDGTEVAFP